MRDPQGLSSMFHRLAEFLRWFIYLFGLFLCLGALACWGVQWYVWVTKDVWHPLPTGKYILIHQTRWAQLDQAIAALLDVNVGYPVFVAGVLLMALSLVKA